MNVHVVLRLLDTFFRRAWLYLVPVVVLGAVGVAAASSADESYQSVGTVRVEADARVSQLTGTQSDPGFGWESPAGATARAMNSLLGTRSFLDDVVDRGGLQESIDAGLATPDEIRGSIGVYADGSQLVKVVGTHRLPEVAQRVSAATIEAYVEAVMANEISDNVVAIEFLQDKQPDYEAAVAAAEDRLAEWIDEHPEPLDGLPRPTIEIVQLQRLQDAVANEDLRLVDLEASLQQAELAVEQKGAEVRQRFAVIDSPEVPTAPLPTLRKTALTVAMALLIGGLITVTAVVITAALDRTIRHPGDFSDRLGMHHSRVLAVLPHVERAARRRPTETEQRRGDERHDPASKGPMASGTTRRAEEEPLPAGSRRRRDRTAGVGARSDESERVG